MVFSFVCIFMMGLFLLHISSRFDKIRWWIGSFYELNFSLSFSPPFLSQVNVTRRCKHAGSLVMISFNHVPFLSSFSSDCRSHLQNKEWAWTWMFCWSQEVFLQAGWKTLPRLMLILISMSTTISVLWGGYLLLVNSKCIFTIPFCDILYKINCIMMFI